MTDFDYKHVFVFHLHRDATGKFPEYPDEDDGGSALIFKEKDPAELEEEMKAKVVHYLLIYKRKHDIHSICEKVMSVCLHIFFYSKLFLEENFLNNLNFQFHFFTFNFCLF